MPEAENPETQHPRDSHPLDRDVTCSGCGYNLRGLLPSGPCPECGDAIADSINASLLPGASPQWILRLRQGVSLGSIATLTAIALPFVGGCVVFIAIGSSATSGHLSGWFWTGHVAVMLGVALSAAWRLTTTDTHEPDTSRRPLLRACCRTCFVLALPLMTLPFACILIGELLSIRFSMWIDEFVNWSIIAGLAAVGLGLVTLNLCLRALAQRVRDASLSRSAGRLAGLDAIVFGLFVGFMLDKQTRISAYLFPDLPIICILCCLPLALLGAGIWQLVLFSTLWDTLNHALPQGFQRQKADVHFGAESM